MDIGLAHTLAGACSLGALYNLGKAVMGSDDRVKLKEETLFALPETIEIPLNEIEDENIANMDGGEELHFLEEEGSEGEWIETPTSKKTQTISRDDLEEYISAIVVANTPKSTSRINSLVTAFSLAAVAYLIIQNDELKTESQKKSHDLTVCQNRLSPPPSINVVQIEALKPPSTDFFGRVTNALIGFFSSSPNNLEAQKSHFDREMAESRFVDFTSNDLMLGTQRRWINLTLSQGTPQVATLHYEHFPVENTLASFNGTSPLYDRIKFDCTEELHRNLTHVKVNVLCNGMLEVYERNGEKMNLLKTFHYESKEKILANSQITNGASDQVGEYHAEEKVGGSSQITTYSFKTSGWLTYLPVNVTELFPKLALFIKEGSAQALNQ